MRGTNQIEACLLHEFHLTDLSIVESHRSDDTVVVMHAGTIDEHLFAVEHEALLGIERERTDAVADGALVEHLLVLLEGNGGLVELGSVG